VTDVPAEGTWVKVTDGPVVGTKSTVFGDAVSTKFMVVALTYETMPANVPPPDVTVPVVVAVKPVPVKVTTVPTGAPTAMPVGVCEVITGPATETAAGNWLLPPGLVRSVGAVTPLLYTTTLYGPATVPVPEADTLNVTAVPELPEALLRMTCVEGVVPSPGKANACEYWLRPVPVNVTVEAGAPATSPVVAFVAVIVGATSEASPMANAFAKRNDAAFPPAETSGLATVTVHSPAVDASNTETTAVIDVALTTEELTTDSVPAAQPSVTVAPGSKPAPAMVTVVLAAVVANGNPEGLTFVTP
jgi:hypothetical protein